jgi:hypothetical protein
MHVKFGMEADHNHTYKCYMKNYLAPYNYKHREGAKL